MDPFGKNHWGSIWVHTHFDMDGFTMGCGNETNVTRTCHSNSTGKFQVRLSSHSPICSQKFRAINNDLLMFLSGKPVKLSL
jgi:hypothetical protein